jgi:cholesterol oxidase
MGEIRNPCSTPHESFAIQVSTNDFDVVVIGSGFGGSVSALRLTEKGYKVAVIEAGKRFEDKDFPKTSWRLHKFLYAPRLGLNGIQRIHILKDVLVLCGAGVGGGSLVYANTLYVPPETYFRDSQWAHITDWQKELAPFYDLSSRMLGVVENPYFSPSDEVIKRAAEAQGRGHTFRLTPVGVHFGAGEGVESADPFFGGAGPSRTGCTHCGECMTGCRHNAKNTLLKNYLYLAEKNGAQVIAGFTVEQLMETENGWKIIARKSTGYGRRTFTARQVIVAAGTYNTQKLLHSMSASHLPNLSKRLGYLSRTNSESLVGAIMPTTKVDYSRGVAITSSFHPDDVTHVEPVRYGHGSNSMGLLQTIMTDGFSARDRRRQWRKAVLANPVLWLRTLNVRKWSERSIIALVMQNVDSSVRVKLNNNKLTSEQDVSNPNATYIPQANDVVRQIAAAEGGFPAGHYGDLIGAPFTAHFVGGCVVGDSDQTGVIDPYHRVWNYPSLHIVDGSAVTANLGVNPSLTITAQAERAMSMWPNKGEDDVRPAQNEPYQRVKPIAPRMPAVPAHAPAALTFDN